MITTENLQARRSLVHRSPIFYGWIVWVIATLGLIATAPGQSFTVSLFIDRFITDFNLDRTTASSLYGLATFIASLSLTWVGRKIDLHGNRLVGTIITVLFAIVLTLMSLINGPVTLFLGFIAIRGLGQGSLGLSSTTIVAQWFKRRRGLMMSLSFVAFAMFQVVYIPWLQRTLDVYDWRQVWIMLAAGVAVVAVLTWLLTCNRPEDFGLLPDGELVLPADDDTAAELPIIEDNWTLSEALRTAVFWVFVSGRVLLPAWGTGLILHQISIFEGLGHSPQVAAETYSLLALLTAGTSLASGVVIDRLRAGWVMVIQMVAMMMAMFMATVMTEDWMLVVYAATFAVAQGTSSVFDGTVWPNLFGRLHQGAIRGFVITMLIGGTAVGPVLFGLSYDTFGNYTPVLWLGIALALIPAILSLFVDKPRRAG